MKKLLIALSILTITACATRGTFIPAPQAYRAQGETEQITITGKLEQELNQGVFTASLKSDLIIYFNNEAQIIGSLDQQGTAELVGKPYKDKPTSASCSSKQTSATTSELRCIVFVGNERAATLTM